MSLMNRVRIMRLNLNNEADVDNDDDDDDDDDGGGCGVGVGDDTGAAAAYDDHYDDRTFNLPRNFFFMSTGNSKNTSQKFLMTG